MNNNVSWDVMPCTSITDVSEEYAASISQVTEITSSETLVNFHTAMQCYIWEDSIFFPYNFHLTLSYAPRTSGTKWLSLPFKFLDPPVRLSRKPVLSAELLVCMCSSTYMDVTGPATILCFGSILHVGGPIRWEIYLCRSLIFLCEPPSHQRQHLLAASQGQNTNHWANSCRRKFPTWWVNQNSFITFRNKSAERSITIIIWQTVSDIMKDLSTRGVTANDLNKE